MALGKAAICCNEPLKHWHDQFNRYDTRLSRICEKVPIRKSGTAGRVRAGLPFKANRPGVRQDQAVPDEQGLAISSTACRYCCQALWSRAHSSHDLPHRTWHRLRVQVCQRRSLHGSHN